MCLNDIALTWSRICLRSHTRMIENDDKQGICSWKTSLLDRIQYFKDFISASFTLNRVQQLSDLGKAVDVV